MKEGKDIMIMGLVVILSVAEYVQMLAQVNTISTDCRYG